jgi:sporulation protein YlmC with PRC-barrel domain
MAHLDIDTALEWRGRTVRDPAGEKIGTFGDVFLDRQTQQPAWGGVRTGLFGHKESYVPLERVEATDDDLVVPYAKDMVKDAPQIDPEVALTASEEEALWRHYGQEYVHIGDDAPGVDTTGGHGMGDDAMTRSEEEVRVHEGPMRPAERVRLRKVMVTEHETRTVPVRKEVVQLETDPAPAGHVEQVVDVDDDPSISR